MHPRSMLPLEKMSTPMQGLYADLRHQYPLAAIELTPEDGVLVLTFKDGPVVRVSETPKGLFRVRATRQVPAGKRTKDVEQAKTAKDARAVLYAIDGFLVDEPKVAHVGPKVATSIEGGNWERTLRDTVSEFRVLVASLLQADVPPAYEEIAHMFIDSLGANPDQLSSQQLGERLSQFIRGDLSRRWDVASVTTEMWADIGRLLSDHGINMDERDFTAAIDRTF